MNATPAPAAPAAAPINPVVKHAIAQAVASGATLVAYAASAPPSGGFATWLLAHAYVAPIYMLVAGIVRDYATKIAAANAAV